MVLKWSFAVPHISLHKIQSYYLHHHFVLSKTKLDKSFPKAQFRIPGYAIRARKGRNKYGGGLIEYAKKVSSLQEFKNLKCSHMNLFNQNWQWLRKSGFV